MCRVTNRKQVWVVGWGHISKVHLWVKLGKHTAERQSRCPLRSYVVVVVVVVNVVVVAVVVAGVVCVVVVAVVVVVVIVVVLVVVLHAKDADSSMRRTG